MKKFCIDLMERKTGMPYPNAEVFFYLEEADEFFVGTFKEDEDGGYGWCPYNGAGFFDEERTVTHWQYTKETVSCFKEKGYFLFLWEPRAPVFGGDGDGY